MNDGYSIDIGYMDPSLIQRVKEDFFDEKIISIDERIEGQGLNEYGGFKLGCKAGPFVCITNLFHEMGHLVELELDRLLQKPHLGWGFRHGEKFVIGGRAYAQMNTDQSVLREARAWAYQISLERHYNIIRPVVEAVSCVTLMDAWLFYRNKVVDKNLPYGERDKLGLQTFADMVDKMSCENYNFDAFTKGWKMRMEKLSYLSQ